jgi:pseudouridine synthase
MRINKFLAHAGIASRRKIDEMIGRGLVEVNNKKALLGQKIDPKKDKVTVNGRTVKGEENLTYIILNKPVGVTTTVSGIHAKKTVIDLVKSKTRIYPVGRLDQNSKGLVLLTNDGDLANKLTHPRYHVPKIYQVIFTGKIPNEKIHKMEKEIELEEGKTKEARVKILSRIDEKTLLEITLFEGRKRQIRRMAQKMRLHIISLKRIAIGPVKLGNLQPSESRSLTENEIEALKEA